MPATAQAASLVLAASAVQQAAFALVETVVPLLVDMASVPKLLKLEYQLAVVAVVRLQAVSAVTNLCSSQATQRLPLPMETLYLGRYSAVDLVREVVVELDSVPIELVRQHLPVGLGNAGRISKERVSLVVDYKTATALIVAEKRAATACFVACRVDSVVTAPVVRADNSLSRCEKKLVVLAFGVDGEMWNMSEHSVVAEMNFVPVDSAAHGNLTLPASTTN